MKYIIASDIHGSAYYTRKLIQIADKEKVDKIILLGDLYYHGPRNPLPYEYNPKEVFTTLNKIADKIIAVKGNCDGDVDKMVSDFTIHDNMTINIGDKCVFLSHGEKFNIDNPPATEYDIMCYGHFHNCFIRESDNKLYINPGSISLPKNDTENSFCIIDEDTNEICIKNFSNQILIKKGLKCN